MNQRSKESRSRRRWPWVLAVMAALAVGGWYGLKAFLHVDRYRPQIVQAITEATGLPAEIGGIALHGFPSPHVAVTDVRLGEADFSLLAPSIEARPDWSSLLSGSLAVSSIMVPELEIRLPEEKARLQAQWNALHAALNAAGGKEGAASPTVSVDAVTVSEARLFLGDSLWLKAAVEGGFPAEGPMEARMGGALPALDAEAAVELAYSSGGTLEVALQLSGLLESALDLAVQIRGLGTEFIEADLTGTGEFHAETGIPALHISANGTWGEQGLHIGQAELTGDGLTVQAAADWSPEAPLAWKVPTASMEQAWLTLLSSRLGLGEDAFSKDARFSTADIEGTWSPGAEPVVAKGKLDLDGLSLALPGGVKPLEACSIRGDVTDNVLHLERFETSGLTAAGVITPDFAGKTVRFGLSGEADLGGDAAAALMAPVTGLSPNGGRVTVERFSFVLDWGKGAARDWDVAALVHECAVDLAFPGWEDRLEGLEGAMTWQAVRLGSQFRGQSSKLGAVEWRGDYLLDTSLLSGTATADWPRLAEIMPDTQAAKPYVAAVLKGYSPATLEITGDFSAGTKVSIARQEEPALRVDGIFSGGQIGALHAEAHLVLDWFKTALPEGIETEGPARLELAKEADADTFSAILHLDEARVAKAGRFEKRTGDACSVTVRGQAGAMPWTLDSVGLVMMDQRAELRYVDGAMRLEDTPLAAETLARLLPEGTTGSGTIRTAFDTAAPSMALVFEQAGFSLTPGADTGTINGPVRIENGQCSVALTLQDTSLKLLDQVLLPESRGLRGRMTGTVDLGFPWGVEEPLSGLNGRIELEGRDGSLGKLGIATKLLTALKTTEVLSLQFPGFGDKGLTFDHAVVKLGFQDGVMTIDEWLLEDKSYTLNASGTVNLAQDEVNVRVALNSLRGITRPLSKVPVLGKPVQLLEKGTSFRFHISGALSDPTVRPAP